MKEEDLLKESLDLTREFTSVMITQSIRFSQIFVDYYEDEIKRKTTRLNELLDNEPPKFFKTIHKDWEQRITQLKEEIEIAQKKLFEEHSCIGESRQLLNDLSKGSD